jgi:hypothetical protein
MSKDRIDQQRLARFYEEAQEAILSLAQVHGVDVPKGVATIEGQCLHWRLSAYATTGRDYWSALWENMVDKLGLPSHIHPGDAVIDPDGETWQLLGLDPMAKDMPVRLASEAGLDFFCSVEQARLLQVIA